ncbi:cytochrome [Bdellovibrio bacteriovorus]|uniref:cytochrome n=1 Tax=Bdellovibrio bacteriovorus TaxID=959 RepID=UPI0021D24C93|nr:cytochrome [Bdellovibrio bacteriovorus]UXR64709.1 cytochrome [Bdellovibrio bacteriovorus]
MFLQGDLQLVFDALYSVGAIDPVLKLDWSEVTREMMANPQILSDAFQTINGCRGNKDLLIQKLHMMDPRSVNYIAMEVAREFCEFQDRTELH